MKERKNVDNITNEEIEEYELHLRGEERSQATVEKYLRDVKKFREFLLLSGDREFDRGRVLEYREYLRENYKINSVNSMLAAINNFFEFMEWDDCKVKLFKADRTPAGQQELELSERDYQCLIDTAERKGDVRMSMLVQTICSTGVRISELKFITVESLAKGYVEIEGRGKSRVVLLSEELIRMLQKYCEGAGILSGSIFVTKGGQTMDRSNINKKMKALGRQAGVDERKVFPHNLRRASARTFYRIEKEVIRLTDIPGYSNGSVASIYTMTTERQPRQVLSRMMLVSEA
ncbi:MAG: tyrosine-type recombinase/integrase [Hungatella hathewayi]|nr:tyrosine-type recombinase/integrase [Hungatella hathewayi]